MATPSFGTADAFDTDTSGAPATSTSSFNPGTSADTLIVGYIRSINQTVSSVTWDGAACTLGTSFTDGDGYNTRGFYKHIGTGAGAKDIVITTSAAITTQFVVSAWIDVDPDDFEAVLDFTNGVQVFTASPTWTIDSAAGDLVAVLLQHQRTNTPGAESPATQVFSESVNDGTYWFNSYIWQEAGDTSVTINGGISGNGWAGVAFNLRGSAGGGGAVGGNWGAMWNRGRVVL